MSQYLMLGHSFGSSAAAGAATYRGKALKSEIRRILKENEGVLKHAGAILGSADLMLIVDFKDGDANSVAGASFALNQVLGFTFESHALIDIDDTEAWLSVPHVIPHVNG